MRRLSRLLPLLLVGCAGAPLIDEGAPLERPTEAGYHHVGQGTHLIVLGAVGVLTDPRPYAELPTDPELVLLTSKRAWSPEALRALDRQASLVVPAARLDEAARLGFASVTGVAPGDRLERHGVELEAFAAGDDLAYLLRREGRAVFIAGDARAAPDTGARLAELCALPAQSDPDDERGFTSRDAVALGERLGCRRAVLTHRAPAVAYPAWFTAPRAGAFVPFAEDQPPSSPASTSPASAGPASTTGAASQ